MFGLLGVYRWALRRMCKALSAVTASYRRQMNGENLKNMENWTDPFEVSFLTLVLLCTRIIQLSSLVTLLEAEAVMIPWRIVKEVAAGSLMVILGITMKLSE